jgi:DNA-binding NarL/FixJ family response regulator
MFHEPAPISAANPSKARVLLVDDHPIVRLGLKQLINAAPDLIVCGEASSAAEALELVRSGEPDIAIVDIALQDRSGVELIKDLLARKEGLRCLALSMYDEATYAVRVLHAGGRGYIMKQEMPKKLLAAIRQVLEGHVYISENMSTRLVSHMVSGVPQRSLAARLSDRELEVLALLGQGISTKEIAERLFLSVKTIEGHRERLKEKLKLKNAAELLRYAVQFCTQAASGGQ